MQGTGTRDQGHGSIVGLPAFRNPAASQAYAKAADAANTAGPRPRVLSGPWSLFPVPYEWLISDAMHPAPKPLSMFTTATPLAHELSMPSRAAMPPKLAP